MMKLSNAQVGRAMALLGLRNEDFRAIECAPTFEEGKQRLDELKARVKLQWRKVAMELHPDRTNNDPAKTDDFKLVSAVVDELARLELRPPPPPPPPVPVVMMPFGRVRIVFSTSGPFASSTTTHTTTSYWDGFGF